MVRRGMMTAMTAPKAPTPRPILTSTANPRVAAAAALRDRRARDRAGMTLIDGAREVRRALVSGVDVTEAFVCEPLLAGPDARAALDRLGAAGVPVHTTSERVFTKVAFGERADGIVAVARIPSLELDRLVLPADPLIVVVEAVEKPGNLGAVLRSADGAGVDAVIAASPRTDLFNPNAIRASAGTLFSIPVAAAGSVAVLAWLHDRGIRTIATRVEAPAPYTEANLTGAVAIALGAETAGLTEAWSGPDVEPVSLPMLGIADSLNVSVTAAILVYEARRQRGPLRPAASER
jgi:RNA methyltransferase, TrmH family